MKQDIILKDQQGNALIVKRSVDERYEHISNLFIKLSSGGRERLIGTIDKNERVLYTSRMRKKHLLQKAESYGFNYDILNSATSFDEVQLTDEYGTFRIPRKAILEEGSFLWFKGEGYERQIFLPINILNRYKQ
jgi:CRISPR/Cas system-associated endonuclease/helicase Cas3